MVFHFSLCLPCVEAGKVMKYDEKMGIIFVDEDSPEARRKAVPLAAPSETLTRTVEKETTVVHQMVRVKKPREDIHIGRKKDPPEVYFKSGIEYFRDGDYASALKNFLHANTLGHSPLIMLWVGKTYRRLNQIDSMLSVMRGIIADSPQADVADDALFEIAVYYQTSDAYDSAGGAYAFLAEQYPFGTSSSTGGLFREVAREQRRAMRDEMSRDLTAMGFKGRGVPAMIRAFQKARGMEPTGSEDRRTVRAIKSGYAGLRAGRTGIGNQGLPAAPAMRIAIGLGVVFLLCNVSLVPAALVLRARRRQVEELRRVLAGLKI